MFSPLLLFPIGSTPAGGPGGIPFFLFRTGSGGGAFPTQYAGLRYYSGTVKELCLMAVADAPAGMGGQIRIDKNGTVYAVYLVDTTDPNASGVRIQTSTGIKSLRLKT